jgi:hypothetical protein
MKKQHNDFIKIKYESENMDKLGGDRIKEQTQIV